MRLRWWTAFYLPRVPEPGDMWIHHIGDIPTKIAPLAHFINCHIIASCLKQNHLTKLLLTCNNINSSSPHDRRFFLTFQLTRFRRDIEILKDLFFPNNAHKVFFYPTRNWTTKNKACDTIHERFSGPAVKGKKKILSLRIEKQNENGASGSHQNHRKLIMIKWAWTVDNWKIYTHESQATFPSRYFK